MDAQRKTTIMRDLSARTTVVVGASRGLGRGIARAFAEAGAAVVAVARTGPALAELATTSANIRTEVADAARPGRGQRAPGGGDPARLGVGFVAGAAAGRARHHRPGRGRAPTRGHENGPAGSGFQVEKP
jgi:NAD(P)-dependent dehydrogenase (short-subunit alcohol dehydrogenase family)